MKLIISGYEKYSPSIALYDVNLDKKEYKVLFSDTLYEPSFLTSANLYNKKLVFTYSKNPLELIMYEVIDDKLNIVDRVNIFGTTLTHLYFDKDVNRLYGCSYKDGSYMFIEVLNGKFGEFKYFEKEKPSLCHCVFPEGDLIDIVDFARDEVICYDKNLNCQKKYTLPKGVGPRHGLYYLGCVYLITEKSNEIYVIDCKTGNIKQSISTLRSNVTSYGATLFINDNYLFASNRGEETIAKFYIGIKLEYIKSFSYFGKNSRHMIKSNNEKYLISCNKDSNDVTIIDLTKDELVLKFPFNLPSCVINL